MPVGSHMRACGSVVTLSVSRAEQCCRLSSRLFTISVESTAIRPVKGKRHDTISVEQGKTFSIRLECVDENRKLVHIG